VSPQSAKLFRPEDLLGRVTMQRLPCESAHESASEIQKSTLYVY
jgi:hypothetical protein